MGFIVAIDGPAGSGKGTVTKIVAEKENLISVDTGAMYRCVTLECLNNGIDFTDTEAIIKVLKDIKIELKMEKSKQEVFLNGQNVTNQIRTPRIDSYVAKYAAIKCIREKMVDLQRKMGETQNIIMEGRDIGTVVFPDADVKIFLDCSVEERAKRRYLQNQEKGIECNYEEILESIIERHKLETQRELSPLKKADDAILIDSSNMTIDEVVDEIIKNIYEKRGI